MKFFFPDSHDLVDPSFNFVTETRSEFRNRHRDDLYAHEVFQKKVPFDGILVSKAIVDGVTDTGRYTIAQRHRLYRQGIRTFFRIEDNDLETMGDCGAFTYVKEQRPPFTVDQVIDFYEQCGFDWGVSIDHVILAYQAPGDPCLPGMDLVRPEWRRRQDITLELATEFMHRHKARKCKFQPIGVAQGWSPDSYANSVKALQKMGFRTIALGGLVPLKTAEILAALEAVHQIRRPTTQLHLFGVTRCEHLADFKRYGVVSFDSTSPLRRAFKDDRDNYYSMKCNYSAIRVPQVDGNPSLRRRVQSGEVNQDKARKLEQACMEALRKYAKRRMSLQNTLDRLAEYGHIHERRKDYADEYRRILKDRPWEICKCDICKAIGIDVVIFRGAERNRRRGFHNLYVFYKQLAKEIRTAEKTLGSQKTAPKQKGTCTHVA